MYFAVTIFDEADFIKLESWLFSRETDKNDIEFGLKHKIDFIALSFVRNANDVLDVNDMLIAERNECDVADIKPETSFADLGIDSLDTVEMIMEFEKEFNITIPEEKSAEILTVGEAISCIEKCINNE